MFLLMKDCASGVELAQTAQDVFTLMLTKVSKFLEDKNQVLSIIWKSLQSLIHEENQDKAVGISLTVSTSASQQQVSMSSQRLKLADFVPFHCEVDHTSEPHVEGLLGSCTLTDYTWPMCKR